MKRLVCAVVAAMMFMGIAYGQVDVETKVIYQKKTIVDFEEMLLVGQIKKPTMGFIIDFGGRDFPPLIKYKENFNKELIKSTDKL